MAAAARKGTATRGMTAAVCLATTVVNRDDGDGARGHDNERDMAAYFFFFACSLGSKVS